jgi:hypothetical protein
VDFAAGYESIAVVIGDLAERFQGYLPSLLLAAGLLLVGWLVGSVLRAAAIRLLGLVEQRFWQKTRRLVEVEAGTERRASEIIGSFVFWAIFVLFLAAATDALGLPVLSIWLSGLSQFLPRLLLATLIVLAGVLAGRLSRDAITAAVTTGGLAFGQALGRGAQVAVVTAAVVTAVDQVGIDSGFFTSVMLIAAGTLLGGTALAFGLGARASAGNIIAVHYVRQRYEVGQAIRVGDVQGLITEIGTTEVVVDTGEALVQVPGHLFARQAAARLKADG